MTNQQLQTNSFIFYDETIPPGMVVKKYFEHFEITPETFRKKYHVDINWVEGVLSSKIFITQTFAEKLSECFNQPPNFWLSLADNYRGPVIYFELNDWAAGDTYPLDEPFLTWVEFGVFNKENWVKQNKICVLRKLIDMSVSYLITAPYYWVENRCPSLFKEHSKFTALSEADEWPTSRYDYDTYYLDYTQENIGKIKTAPDDCDNEEDEEYS